MNKRLLEQEESLSKIELSLKLNGKALKIEFLSCIHCKFAWGETYQRPETILVPYTDPITGQRILKKEGLPKNDWYCYNYKGYPYHAGLRFKIVRLNAEGQPIPITYHLTEPTASIPSHYTREPKEGERDTLILIEAGQYFTHIICRRFESNPGD